MNTCMNCNKACTKLLCTSCEKTFNSMTTTVEPTVMVPVKFVPVTKEK